MVITATEAQNNFGKYLRLCKNQNVIITKNGKRQALLVAYPPGSEGFEICESIPDYGTSPRKNPDWVTYSEFMEMCENSENRYELIDGVVYLLASPAVSHQRILGKMHVIFMDFFSECDDCDPFLAPFDIKVVRYGRREEQDVLEYFTNVVQPDLLVLCDYENDINEKDKFDGTPVLVVEILSPSNRRKDMIKKLDLYSESGIDEFWQVDPKNSSVTVYVFSEEGVESTVIYTDAQTAESVRFPGLKVSLADLF